MDGQTPASHTRLYRFVKNPPTQPKGVQRLFFLAAIRNAGKPVNAIYVAGTARKAGLAQPAAGFVPSAAWHLHQMAKEGWVALVEQPTTPAAATTPVISFGTDTVADHVIA